MLIIIVKKCKKIYYIIYFTIKKNLKLFFF